MCYHLYLATPLTLSEVRSMLPMGVAAHLLPAPFREPMLDLLPAARDVLLLSSGGCACDLTGRRLHDTAEDERRLRKMYRERKADRGSVIEAFVAHRRRAAVRGAEPPGPAVLAGFIAEHARNAGRSLFYLHFTAEPEQPPDLARATSAWTTVAAVRAAPTEWLQDETVTIVDP